MTVASINAQLTLLLEIQDLRAQEREFRGESGLRTFEKDHFGIDPEVASKAIHERIEELKDRLSEPVRRRFERVADRVGRVVVPVISGTCYGCFVSVATATAGEAEPNAELQTCETCGRFLYFLS